MEVSARLKDPKGAVYVYDWIATQISWTERGDYLGYVNSINHETASNTTVLELMVMDYFHIATFFWMYRIMEKRLWLGFQMTKADTLKV